MADVEITVGAASFSLTPQRNTRSFVTETGEEYKESIGGERMMLAVEWHPLPRIEASVRSSQWRLLAREIMRASNPANVTIFDFQRVFGYKRQSTDMPWEIDGDYPQGVDTVLVRPSSLEDGGRTINGVIMEGDVIEIGGEIKLVTREVRSPYFLELGFEPVLRKPVKTGASVEVTNPRGRWRMRNNSPPMSVTRRAIGVNDNPWLGVTRAEFVETDDLPRPQPQDPVRMRTPPSPTGGDDGDGTNVNDPPTAVVTPPMQTRSYGERVVLQGNRSSDPNGHNISFAWSQISGMAVTIYGANSAEMSFTAPNRDWTGVFRLVVTDSENESSQPAYGNVRVRAAAVVGPPDAPLSFTAYPQQNSCSFSWTEASTGGPLSHFLLRINKGTVKGDWVLVDPGAASPTRRYRLAGLDPATDYTADLKAVGPTPPTPALESAEVSISFTTLAVPDDPDVGPMGKPNQPTGLQADAHVDTADLEWTAPSTAGGKPAATGYRLQYVEIINGRADFSSASAVTENIGTETTRTIRNLKQGTNYDWRLAAKNGDLVTDYVDGNNFLTRRANQPIGQVVNLRAAVVSDTEITWRWEKPSVGIVSNGYKWTIREIGIPRKPGGKLIAEGNSGSVLQVVTSNLKPSTLYRFFVSPLGPAGGAPNGPIAQTGKTLTLVQRTSAAPAPMTPPSTPSAGTLRAAAGDDVTWTLTRIWAVTYYTAELTGAAALGEGAYEYAWSFADDPAPTGVTLNPRGRHCTVTTTTRQSVNVRLTVTDGGGNTATDDVRIT